RFKRQAAGDSRYEAVGEIYSAQQSLLRAEPAADALQQVQTALAAGLPLDASANTLFVALGMFAQVEAYDTAKVFIDAGLDAARRQGLAARQGLLLGQRALVALGYGALDDAQLEAETGLALIDERHAAVLQL